MPTALPKGLERVHIKRAVKYVEEQSSALIDVYFEQANVFSAIIGIMGVKALDAFSPYKKHKHPDVAQQRFPDLSLAGKLTRERVRQISEVAMAKLGQALEGAG